MQTNIKIKSSNKTNSQKNINTIFDLIKNSAEMFFKFYIIILIYLYTNSIPAVFYYVLGQSIIYFTVTFLFKEFLKNNSKTLLLISIIPFVLMHLMFFMSANNYIFILFVSMFSALYTSTTWVSFNTISSTQNKSMLSLSLVNFLSVLVALFSGYFIDNFSIYYVVIIGIILYFTAIMLAYFLYDFNKGISIANSEIIQSQNQQLVSVSSQSLQANENNNLNTNNEALQKDRNTNNKICNNPFSYKPWLAEMFVALIFVIECLWMVFVYIKYQKFSSVGVVRALVLIGSFVSTYIVSVVKNKKLITFLAISSILIACVSYIIRVYAFYDATIFVLSFLIGFLTPMFLLPLGKMYLNSNYNHKTPLSANFNKSSYKRLVSIPFTILAIIINSLSFSIVIFSLLLSYLSVQFTNRE